MVVAITTSNTGAGTHYTIGDSFDYFLLQNVSLVSTNGTALLMNAFSSSATLVVGGNIAGSYGINTDSGGGSRTIHVLSEGFVFGTNAGVRLTGLGDKLRNYGEISGYSAAAEGAGDNNTVLNYGSMSTGLQSVIFMEGANARVANFGDLTGAVTMLGGGINRFENSGLLNASVDAVIFSGGADRVINTGRIIGNIGTSSGEDVVVNAGRIDGDIFLEDGSDRFDGRGGVLNGAVYGGGGEDLYIVDDADIEIVESSLGGVDTVHSTVTFTLGDYFEHLKLIGTANIDGYGNSDMNELIGNSGANILDGGGSHDTIDGRAGDDRIFGGFGEDVLVGGKGADLIDGGADFDRVEYESSAAGITLNLVTGAGKGGDAEGDTVLAIERIIASYYDDVITGNEENNELYGLEGVDTFIGAGGDDTLVGHDGNDVMTGGSGADYIHGGIDFDTASYATSLAGITVDLAISTQSGGDAQGDVLTAVEALAGSGFNDTLSGDGNANTLDGRAGDDFLNGRAGDDLLLGAGGNDRLNGGGGNDTMNGGGGNDEFVFGSALGPSNLDIIQDFNVVADTMRLEDAVFTGLALGTLAVGAFRTGAAAADADDRIIYNAATGALSFDADGNGAGAAVQFATISAGLALTNADFVVF